jgi:hypothetical protein
MYQISHRNKVRSLPPIVVCLKSNDHIKIFVDKLDNNKTRMKGPVALSAPPHESRRGSTFVRVAVQDQWMTLRLGTLLPLLPLMVVLTQNGL